jgi:hypothetical protein
MKDPDAGLLASWKHSGGAGDGVAGTSGAAGGGDGSGGVSPSPQNTWCGRGLWEVGGWWVGEWGQGGGA